MTKFSPHCQVITWQHPFGTAHIMWAQSHCTPSTVGFPCSESVCDQSLPNPEGPEPAGRAVGSCGSGSTGQAGCQVQWPPDTAVLETEGWEQGKVAGVSAQVVPPRCHLEPRLQWDCQVQLQHMQTQASLPECQQCRVQSRAAAQIYIWDLSNGCLQSTPSHLHLVYF